MNTQTDVQEMTLAEWRAEGEKRFGPEVKEWKFKCPRCGNVQTARDFLELMTEEETMTCFYFSCIGRWKEGTGCNWTLGGLFSIHKLVVVAEDAKRLPVFEFADVEEES